MTLTSLASHIAVICVSELEFSETNPIASLGTGSVYLAIPSFFLLMLFDRTGQKLML